MYGLNGRLNHTLLHAVAKNDAQSAQQFEHHFLRKINKWLNYANNFAAAA